jgi:shikimate kinase
VPAATALARALEGTERPLLAGGEGLARITSLLHERKDHYEQADFTIDNHGDDPAVAAMEIVEQIRRGGSA